MTRYVKITATKIIAVIPPSEYGEMYDYPLPSNEEEAFELDKQMLENGDICLEEYMNTSFTYKEATLELLPEGYEP